MSEREAMTAQIREKHDGTVTGPEAGRGDVGVWLRLLSCSTIIEKRLRRRFIDKHGTTLPRFDILSALEREPDGMTMGDLSRALLVSNGNVTALVRQLEAQGYVKSRADPEDRRSFRVALTPVGRTHFAEFATAHHRWIKGMFAGMGREEQTKLYALLAALKSSIAAEEYDEGAE